MQIIFSSVVGWLSAMSELVDGNLCFCFSSDEADKMMRVEFLPKGLLSAEQLEWHPDWEHSTFCLAATEKHESGWDGFPLKISLVNTAQRGLLLWELDDDVMCTTSQSTPFYLQSCKFSWLSERQTCLLSALLQKSAFSLLLVIAALSILKILKLSR